MRLFSILYLLRMMNGGKHPSLPFSTQGTHWLLRPWVVIWLVFRHRKEIQKATHQTGTKPQARRPKQTNLPPKITYL
jgi:hypothetical protein